MFYLRRLSSSFWDCGAALLNHGKNGSLFLCSIQKHFLDTCRGLYIIIANVRETFSDSGFLWGFLWTFLCAPADLYCLYLWNICIDEDREMLLYFPSSYSLSDRGLFHLNVIFLRPSETDYYWFLMIHFHKNVAKITHSYYLQAPQLIISDLLINLQVFDSG